MLVTSQLPIQTTKMLHSFSTCISAPTFKKVLPPLTKRTREGPANFSIQQRNIAALAKRALRSCAASQIRQNKLRMLKTSQQ